MDMIEQGVTLLKEHWLLTTVFAVTALIYWHYMVTFTLIKKLGIPGPSPWPFLGNSISVLMGKPFHNYLDEVVEKYGKVCGIYFVKEPTIIISDPDMLKSIFVKEFECFHDVPFEGFELEKPLSSMMISLEGERWKNVRSTLTPTFTSGKLKQMMFIMNEAADVLLGKMEKAASEKTAVDIHQWQQGVTMEVILSSAFGLKTDSQTDPNDKLTKIAKRAMNPTVWPSLALIVPFIGNKLANMLMHTPLGYGWDPLVNVAKGAIADRRKGVVNNQRQDMLSLMLAAQEPGSKGYHLTDDEVLAQMFLFILAGFDTSSNVLGLTCYHFAVFPETQEKVLEEIQRVCKSHDSVTYDEIHNMPYLEACISETLRLYPPGFAVARSVTKSCVINGVQFKKGMSVFIPVYSLHRDERYWPDPENFMPERFLPENKDSIHPYTYLPFGDGPRGCIGLRFAWMEMKSVLVRMLMKYRLVRGPETHVPLKMTTKAVLTPDEPVCIRIEKRE